MTSLAWSGGSVESGKSMIGKVDTRRVRSPRKVDHLDIDHFESNHGHGESATQSSHVVEDGTLRIMSQQIAGPRQLRTLRLRVRLHRVGLVFAVLQPWYTFMVA